MERMWKIRKNNKLTDNKEKIGNKTHKITIVIKISSKSRNSISKFRKRKKRKKYKKNDNIFKLIGLHRCSHDVIYLNWWLPQI